MSKQTRVLGRILTCHDWGWSLETDPSLIELAVERMGLEEAKGIGTPKAVSESSIGGRDIRSRRLHPEVAVDGEKEWPGYDGSEVLSGDGMQRYRSVQHYSTSVH